MSLVRGRPWELMEKFRDYVGRGRMLLTEGFGEEISVSLCGREEIKMSCDPGWGWLSKWDQGWPRPRVVDEFEVFPLPRVSKNDSSLFLKKNVSSLSGNRIIVMCLSTSVSESEK